MSGLGRKRTLVIVPLGRRAAYWRVLRRWPSQSGRAKRSVQRENCARPPQTRRARLIRSTSSCYMIEAGISLGVFTSVRQPATLTAFRPTQGRVQSQRSRAAIWSVSAARFNRASEPYAPVGVARFRSGAGPSIPGGGHSLGRGWPLSQCRRWKAVLIWAAAASLAKWLQLEGPIQLDLLQGGGRYGLFETQPALIASDPNNSTKDFERTYP